MNLQRGGRVPHLVSSTTISTMDVGLLHERSRIVRRKRFHETISFVNFSSIFSIHGMSRLPDLDILLGSLIELKFNGWAVPIGCTAIKRNLLVRKIQRQMAIFKVRSQDGIC